MPKLLVIDKSVFHQTVLHETYRDRLAEFVKKHHVILPHALGVECIISNGKNGKNVFKEPIQLLKKLEDMVKTGANIALSPSVIFRYENKTKKAINCIIDTRGTNIVKSTQVNLDQDLLKEEARKARKAFQPNIDFCKNLAITYYDNLVKKGYEKSFRKDAEQTTLISRLKDWIRVSDKMRGEILKSQLPGLSKYITDDNDQWFSWQVLRIIFAWALEWAFKRNQSGPSFKGDIENDFYDMEYVACLNNSDGVLTNDKNLVIPLAQAAFPEKDIFPSIDEVSEDYKL